jgi:hypothetical protein
MASKTEGSPIKLKEFMNTAEELHAWVIGVGELFPPWPAIYKRMTRKRRKELDQERHYYVLGRITGFVIWILIIVAIVERFIV